MQRKDIRTVDCGGCNNCPSALAVNFMEPPGGEWRCELDERIGCCSDLPITACGRYGPAEHGGRKDFCPECAERGRVTQLLIDSTGHVLCPRADCDLGHLELVHSVSLSMIWSELFKERMDDLAAARPERKVAA